MTKLIHVFYNMDTNSVELTYNDGSVLTIDCEKVENHYDVTNGQMADLDWLLYNAAMEYASLVLSGEMENYLKGPALHGIEDSYRMPVCRVCDTPANKTSLRTFLSMRPVQKRFGIRYNKYENPNNALRREPKWQKEYYLKKPSIPFVNIWSWRKKARPPWRNISGMSVLFICLHTNRL